MDREIHVYSNSDVEKIVAGIPSGHYHTRFAIFLKDQVIILQEATVAALVRAYAYTSIHPTRRGIILVQKLLGSNEKKHGFAKYQLIEISGSGDKAVKIIDELLGVSRAETSQPNREDN